MNRFGCAFALGTALSAWGLASVMPGASMIRGPVGPTDETLRRLSDEADMLEARGAAIRERITRKIWAVQDWCRGEFDTASLISFWIGINQMEPGYPHLASSHYPGWGEEEIAVAQIAAELDGLKPFIDSLEWQYRLEELAAHTAGP
ncbi:MAG: hypothetical protein KJS91_10260 [Planctomycetes bacterium]|nr:hypothetical protein [Planctomycetota bacterium]